MEQSQFDFNKISKLLVRGQYETHLTSLGEGFYLDSIREVVEGAVKNIKEGKKSFIIYGEPQSGKTEMIISLTSKLLDEGYKTIIVLVTDQITLLSQNLLRFKKAGLSPSPRNYKEVLENDFNVQNKTLVILCKKNSSNLKKLISKLENNGDKIIIDDEADYATPNSKVNRKEISKINLLTGKLISDGGIYIGVTATPARLDLNNTHKNKTSAWIHFKPHPKYTGQDHFFPPNMNSVEYKPILMPEEYDSSYLRRILFRFLINVGYLNTNLPERGYSMLVHTSRKKIDHSEDKRQIRDILQELSKKDKNNQEKIWEELWQLAKDMYNKEEADKIVNYIFNNIDRHEIKVLNSNRDKTLDSEATNPVDPFTIIIGGDIVSRGMTFDRLLSMFFTRDVKTIFNQDTYIQRARMFGNRKEQLKYFELAIPTQLFSDWHTSFMLHRLSLKSIETGNGPPVWIEGGRIRSTGHGSIDKGTVVIHKGEIISGLFNYNQNILDIINDNCSYLDKVKKFSSYLGDTFPTEFIADFIEKNWLNNGEKISLRCNSVENWGEGVNKEEIYRPRRFIRSEDGVHQFLILFNNKNKARLFYRPAKSDLRFLINSNKINKIS